MFQKVTTQIEFNAAVKAGMDIEVDSGFWEVKVEIHIRLRDNASAELRGNASAELRGNASAVLRDNASAELWGNARAELWGNARAELRDNARAVLRDNASAVLRDNASAVLRDNARAVLWDNARAELRGNARAELRGNARAELRDNASAFAWSKSIAVVLSVTAKVIGNVFYPNKQTDVNGWLKRWGVKIKAGSVILYKATGKDYVTRNDVAFVPHTHVVAPDWEDREDIECGSGLHFCPHPTACKQFRGEIEHYVACKVKVEDLRAFNSMPNYPDKIRGKQCDVLYECDELGNKKDRRQGDGH